jgi:hypothetical protein
MSKLTIHTNKAYCVYVHSYQGTVFYIGKGRPYRPFESSRHNRTWTDFVSAVDSYDVEIVLWTNDAKEARHVEAQLIREQHPLCNQFMNGFINSAAKDASSRTHKGTVLSLETRQKISEARQRVLAANGGKGHPQSAESRAKTRAGQRCTRIMCIETGEAFPSITNAALVMSIPEPTLRFHMRGQLTHARGYTFKKLA